MDSSEADEKAYMAGIVARMRELKAAFDAAHADGMRALETHDHVALSRAIDNERRILDEQIALVTDFRERPI
jgi:hypothetical protein